MASGGTCHGPREMGPSTGWGDERWAKLAPPVREAPTGCVSSEEGTVLLRGLTGPEPQWPPLSSLLQLPGVTRHIPPEAAEQERKQTFSIKLGPVGSAHPSEPRSPRRPPLISQALVLTDSPSKEPSLVARSQGGSEGTGAGAAGMSTRHAHTCTQTHAHTWHARRHHRQAPTSNHHHTRLCHDPNELDTSTLCPRGSQRVALTPALRQDGALSATSVSSSDGSPLAACPRLCLSDRTKPVCMQTQLCGFRTGVSANHCSSTSCFPTCKRG